MVPDGKTLQSSAGSLQRELYLYFNIYIYIYIYIYLFYFLGILVL